MRDVKCLKLYVTRCKKHINKFTGAKDQIHTEYKGEKKLQKTTRKLQNAAKPQNKCAK